MYQSLRPPTPAIPAEDGSFAWPQQADIDRNNEVNNDVLTVFVAFDAESNKSGVNSKNASEVTGRAGGKGQGAGQEHRR